MARISVFFILSLLAAGCGAPPSGQDDAQNSRDAAPSSAERPPETLAEQGRRRFSACAVCHSARVGEAHRVGPNLYDIAGKPAGALDDFVYSKAMATSGVIWTDENLDAYIENPQLFMRGNRMAYAGEKNPEARAAIIAYLKTLSAPKE